MVIKVTNTVDEAYAQIIAEKASRTIKPNFLTVYVNTQTGDAFAQDCVTRLQAMNAVLQATKTGRSNVGIYRLQDGEYNYDGESTKKSFEPRTKKEREKKPVEVSKTSAKESKQAARQLEAVTHALATGGEFGPDIRREYLQEFLNFWNTIGGTGDEIVAAMEDTEI